MSVRSGWLSVLERFRRQCFIMLVIESLIFTAAAIIMEATR